MYRIKRFFYNLFFYFPMLLDDRDYDYIFFLKYVRYKLIKMEKFYRSGDAYSADKNKMAKEIRICKLLVDRIVKDDYNVWEKHTRKWGEIELIPEKIGLRFSRPNIKSEKDKIKEKKESKMCFDHEEYLKKQDISYLGKMLSKHMYTWWD